MDRRTLLRTGGMAAIGLGFGACAGKSIQPVPNRGVKPRPAIGLVPVDVSWDRIIHTTVGLRPFRDSGFRVEPEKLGHKTVIHNYGHGGGGMSISWGSGYLAAEMALAHTSRRVAVLGSGVIGLAASRQLQRRGFDVTIYTKAIPPHTTSNMSLAGWTPTSRVITISRRTPQWDEQFRFAATQAYRELQLMSGRDYGVTWVDNYGTSDEIPPERMEGPRTLLPPELRTGREVLGPGEHPFPLKYASRTPGMRIEPAVFLDAMRRDFRLFGGRTVIREFSTPRDLMSLSETLIVNCTGLGSRDLFDDQEMTPVKGQLTLLAPQDDVNYTTFGGLSSTSGAPGMRLHMTPRRDGIALGGTAELGEWSTEPNAELRKKVVEGHIAFFNAMRAPWRSSS
ncbi:MAG: FAD-dependent oxidoreductase [Acidobacteriota bacterium]|nr:MAG: FAD-dependent oxidoreductase [Acidobacteriota bacterium]